MQEYQWSQRRLGQKVTTVVQRINWSTRLQLFFLISLLDLSIGFVPIHSSSSSSPRLHVPSAYVSHTTSRKAGTLLFNNAKSSFDSSEEMERLSQVHNVIEKLKVQIPEILSTPLTEASSKTVYDDNVKLVVSSPSKPGSNNSTKRARKDQDIVLASSREEIVSLSTTLVLAMLATNQANSFLSLASPFGRPISEDPIPSKKNRQQSSESSLLQSKMVIDPSVRSILVQWKANLPGGGTVGETSTGSNRRQLQGVSELDLDENTGKVTTMRLLQVQWNGENLNARAIGESLASLRQFVFAFQKSPVLKAFLPSTVVPSVSSLIEEVTARQQSPGGSKFRSERAPLFVVDSLQTAFPSTAGGDKTGASVNSTSTKSKLIPIEEYNNNKMANSTGGYLPLPGSKVWNEYVISRKIMAKFVADAVPVLSGKKIVSSKEMLALFGTRATLKAMDGSELLRGRDPIGNYFHTLASWRKRSSGTWNLTRTSLLAWEEELKISIDYNATSFLPGSSFPVIFEGTDVFVLQKPLSNTEEDNDDNGNGDNDDTEILIQRVEQTKLDIRGFSQNQPDGLWFMKSMVTALDTSRFSSVGADSVIMDLLQRMIAGDVAPNGRVAAVPEKEGVPVSSERKGRSAPRLSESAAANVYYIMSKLHHDLPSLFQQDNLSRYQPPPLHDFMTDSVELRGYLGETLARGSQSYNRVLGTTLSSLKGALVTGSVKMQASPSISVELTADGDVRLTMTLELKVLPLPSGASNLVASISGSTVSTPSGGFPLKIVLVSDYLIEKQTGEIYQHRLRETRINGQLTPGDVISRWIQKQVDMTPDGSAMSDKANSGIAFQRGLIDAVTWVRSMSGRKQ